MKIRILFLLFTIVISGCTSTYKHTELRATSAKLDSSQGVLISVPKDGWYGNTHYRNSGRMTANAVRAAFSKHVNKVDISEECHGDDCLHNINIEKHGYYVKPEILHWEDRATEWSGIPDRVEIQIVVFDTATKVELANSSYTGKSKWATLGGDHPQDLLPEPTNAFVNTLYK